MRFFYHFLWLVEMTFEVVLSLWPVSLTLLLSLMASLILGLRLRLERVARIGALTLSPFLLPVLILVCGAAFRRESGSAGADAQWPHSLILIFLIAHIPLGLYSIIKHPKIFWTIMSATGLSMWISWWGCLIASMSISGDWAI